MAALMFEESNDRTPFPATMAGVTPLPDDDFDEKNDIIVEDDSLDDDYVHDCDEDDEDEDDDDFWDDEDEDDLDDSIDDEY